MFSFVNNILNYITNNYIILLSFFRLINVLTTSRHFFLSFGGIHKSAIYKTYDDARDFKINICSNLNSLKFNDFLQ